MGASKAKGDIKRRRAPHEGAEEGGRDQGGLTNTRMQGLSSLQEPILMHERRPPLVQPPMPRRQPQVHQLRWRRIRLPTLLLLLLLLVLWCVPSAGARVPLQDVRAAKRRLLRAEVLPSRAAVALRRRVEPRPRVRVRMRVAGHPLVRRLALWWGRLCGLRETEAIRLLRCVKSWQRWLTRLLRRVLARPHVRVRV